MIVRVYKNVEASILFIEGVTSGSILEFDVFRNDEYFSIWRKGERYFEVKDIHYSFYRDFNNNSFSTPDLLEIYLRTLLKIQYTFIEKSEVFYISDLSDSTYSLDHKPKPNSLEIFLNGLRERTDSVSVSDQTIDFSNLDLGVGDQIIIDYIYEL